MSIFWYFLMAVGFLIMVLMSVPDDAPPPQSPPVEQGDERPAP